MKRVRFFKKTLFTFQPSQQLFHSSDSHNSGISQQSDARSTRSYHSTHSQHSSAHDQHSSTHSQYTAAPNLQNSPAINSVQRPATTGQEQSIAGFEVPTYQPNRNAANKGKTLLKEG